LRGGLHGLSGLYAQIAGHEKDEGAVEEARGYGAEHREPTATLGQAGLWALTTKQSGLVTFFNA